LTLKKRRLYTKHKNIVITKRNQLSREDWSIRIKYRHYWEGATPAHTIEGPPQKEETHLVPRHEKTFRLPRDFSPTHSENKGKRSEVRKKNLGLKEPSGSKGLTERTRRKQKEKRSGGKKTSDDKGSPGEGGGDKKRMQILNILILMARGKARISRGERRGPRCNRFGKIIKRVQVRSKKKYNQERIFCGNDG